MISSRVNNIEFKPSDAVNWYWEELASKVVAESGIPTDKYHLGKILLRVFKENPDAICQIDGATGHKHTNGQVLEKTVKCARALQNLGVKRGDVVLILSANHLDLAIPFYACFYIGASVAGIDRTFKTQELSMTFRNTKPKIIFCQDEKSSEIQQALNNENLEAPIITFDKGDNFTTFSQFLEKHGGQESSVDDFKATDFDPAETIGYMLSTSGTTGLPKLAAITHQNLTMGSRMAWSNYIKFPECVKLHMNISPLQWQSAALMHLSTAIFKVPQLITSGQMTHEHFFYLLRTYQPELTLLSPNFMSSLFTSSDEDLKALSCFKIMYLGGSTVHKELVNKIKKISPETIVFGVYGLSEIATTGFIYVDGPIGSVGCEAPCFQYKLINTETKEVIVEPNVPGELWLKGPSIFKGYYNNPEATRNAFTDDGWFKTGDLLYKNERGNYFFHDRQKFVLIYKGEKISPTELEDVIRVHPGVLDVVVTGRPGPPGDLPVAVVVPVPGKQVEAQEIMDLVKEKLSDSKQLRGGVIFLKEIPLLPTGKIDRQKLKNLVNSD